MINKTILDCGLVILTESKSEYSSVAVSYSLKSGSRAEDIKTNGIHHLVEHMMFKGSNLYDVKAIADLSDRLGGRLNAFTGKEISQYYIKAIGEKLVESFNLLTDIVLHSTFPEQEFVRERNVVLQEINESEDNPDSFAFDNFFDNVFNESPLGFPIAGKTEGISSLERQEVYDFYQRKYSPDELILAAVGNIEHQHLVELAQKAFVDFPAKNPGSFTYEDAHFKPFKIVKNNSALNQVYVIVGFKGISFIAPNKYPFMMMNDILGSGMSSRLFQTIREEKGLVYTISSFNEAFLECGLHMIYGVTEPAKLDEYINALGEEVHQLKQKGIEQEELERAKDHIKSSIILGTENNISKMRFNVNQELYLKRELPLQEIVQIIDRTTLEDINRVCQQSLDTAEIAMLIYGPVTEKECQHLSIQS